LFSVLLGSLGLIVSSSEVISIVGAFVALSAEGGERSSIFSVRTFFRNKSLNIIPVSFGRILRRRVAGILVPLILSVGCVLGVKGGVEETLFLSSSEFVSISVFVFSEEIFGVGFNFSESVGISTSDFCRVWGSVCDSFGYDFFA